MNKLNLLFFNFCLVPGEPGMFFRRSTNSLSVTVRKAYGRYAVWKYCTMIVGRGNEMCRVENSPYKNSKYEATFTFSSLDSYTNYTVQGWIINRISITGSISSRIVQTLPDSKPIRHVKIPFTSHTVIIS